LGLPVKKTQKKKNKKGRLCRKRANPNQNFSEAGKPQSNFFFFEWGFFLGEAL